VKDIRAYRTAKVFIIRGQPIPVDIIVRLIDSGIDPTELERKYRPEG